jgi:hypothetical protein
MNPNKIKSLVESFATLGWNEDQIRTAIDTIQRNPDKQTIVMPKHYEAEANLHAKNTCKHLLKLSESDPRYKNEYKKAFKQYLIDAYENSTGIDMDSPDFAQNPTTPRAEAAYVAVLSDVTSPFSMILKKLLGSGSFEEEAAAKKFRATLKSGSMTLTNLYMQFIGKLGTKAPFFPEKSFTGQPTDFEFVKKYSSMSAEEKEQTVREIGINNLMRGVVFASILHSIEHVFRIDFKKLRNVIEAKTINLPKSTFTDAGWRAEFFQALSYVLATRLKDVNLNTIISDAFEQVKPKFVGNIIAGTNLDDTAAGNTTAGVALENLGAAGSWSPGAFLGGKALAEATKEAKIDAPKNKLKIIKSKAVVEDKRNIITQEAAVEIVKKAKATIERKNKKAKEPSDIKQQVTLFDY